MRCLVRFRFLSYLTPLLSASSHVHYSLCLSVCLSVSLCLSGYLCLSLSARPRELTFTWWGCYGLCLDINQLSLPTPFYSDLVSISVFMALSTVFHSINSPDNSLFSHSVLPVLFLLYRSFQMFISLRKSSSTLM